MRILKLKLNTHLLLACGIWLCSSGVLGQNLIENHINLPLQVDQKKLTALQVLRAKCNGCHQQKNPRKIFTQDNMSELAAKIYKQVFIKKRMPKGRATQLTQDEYNILQQWLITENIL